MRISHNRNKNAFTLIELAISLIVIGIIIAAVMQGGDIIKSGDSKQFYQNFAGKWVTVVNGYYDRMGKELMDFDNDGFFDGVEPNENDVLAAGININKVVTTAQLKKTTYQLDSEFAGYQLVTVYLGAYKVENTPYNFVLLTNIPVEIATAIDKYVDGTADGTNGNSLVIQESISDNDLPDNYKGNSSSPIIPLAFNSITTKTTNLGILVEH